MKMAPIKPPTFIHFNVRIILQQGNMILFFTQGVYFETLSCMYSKTKRLPARPHRYNATITGLWTTSDNIAAAGCPSLCLFRIVWFYCKLQFKLPF